ncbi:MAG: hypothetical protein ACXAEU_08270 [Candidatus Hodarchaeales archaeon]|jgi:hypothetical protein
MNDEECPKFAWIILVSLGFLDLFRGFIHTFLLEFAAMNIAGLNLTVVRDDQLMLLGVFGISNYVTGVMMILIGLKARKLVLPVLILIPTAYFLGSGLISRVATPQATFGGASPMMVYFIVCIATFVASVVYMYYRRSNNQSST